MSSDVLHASAVVLRICTAVFGGYLLAVSLGATMVHTLPLHRAEAVDLSIALSFLVHAAAALWAFAAGTAMRAAVGVLGPGVLLGLLALFLAPTGS